MSLESPPFAFQSGSYTAPQVRRAIFSTYARTAANTPGLVQGGVLSSTDCAVTAASSGLSVNVSVGEMLIPGSESSNQGAYYCLAPTVTNVPLAAANPTNPRVDLICAIASDGQYGNPAGGTAGQVVLAAITGTPTAGATLANLSGAPSLPLSSLLLGYVLVGAGVTSLTGTDVESIAPVAGQLAGLHHNGDYQNMPGAILTTIDLDPSTSGSITIGAVNTWYLVASFPAITAPPSGKVRLVAHGGLCWANGNSAYYAGVLQDGVLMSPTLVQAVVNASPAATEPPLHLDVPVTGLTPDDQYTLQIGVATSATNGTFAWGPDTAEPNNGGALTGYISAL